MVSPFESAWVGIDPGQTGCLCVLTEHDELMFYDWRCVDEAKAELLTIKDSWIIKGVALENVKPSVFSKVSNFKLGWSKGAWEALLGASQIPYELVGPKKWQNKHHEFAKDSELLGKRRTLSASWRLYPHCADFIYRIKDHNRADALLLAHYARHHMED